MLSSVFQDSKSALAFAASVIVCALLLVGPKDKGGVLDQAVETYADQRGNIAANAAMTSEQMSQPMIGDYRPGAAGLDDGVAPGQAGAAANAVSLQVTRLDPVTLEPIGEVPPPPPADAPESYAPQPLVAAPSGVQTIAQQPAREAVVTARTIRIEPQ